MSHRPGDPLQSHPRRLCYRFERLGPLVLHHRSKHVTEDRVRSRVPGHTRFKAVWFAVVDEVVNSAAELGDERRLDLLKRCRLLGILLGLAQHAGLGEVIGATRDALAIALNRRVRQPHEPGRETDVRLPVQVRHQLQLGIPQKDRGRCGEADRGPTDPRADEPRRPRRGTNGTVDLLLRRRVGI